MSGWRRVLLDAADRLERIGWAPDAGHCIYTEMRGARADEEEACERFAAHIGDKGQSPVTAIWKWNDTPTRTKEEVLTALRDCAKSA